MQRFKRDRVLSALKLREIQDADWSEACDAIVWMLNQWWMNDRTICRLVLVGGVGSGKTELARGAAKIADRVAIDASENGRWNRIPTVACHSWPRLLKSSEVPWIFCETADFAVLDDIGREVDTYKSGQPTEALSEMLDCRKRRFTIITTNVPEAEWKNRWDTRVASRLYHHAFMVNLRSHVDLRKTL